MATQATYNGFKATQSAVPAEKQLLTGLPVARTADQADETACD